jgi:hypothetical protein
MSGKTTLVESGDARVTFFVASDAAILGRLRGVFGLRG